MASRRRLPAEEAVVLTPAPPDAPRINGARVFGVRPGRPFLFTIAATGQRPMTFAADGLPPGLRLDAQTGLITGQLHQPGEHVVTLRAKNALGEATRKLRIVVGDTHRADAAAGLEQLELLRRRPSATRRSAPRPTPWSIPDLIQHGWTYINIDDCWEAGRDAEGRIQSNQKFPDMKALSDYIHAKGLKFGIYSSPGPKTCAGFEATWQHEDLDAQRYAEWGVDYVKYDWCSYGDIAQQRTAQRYAEAAGGDAQELVKLMQEKAGWSATASGRPSRTPGSRKCARSSPPPCPSSIRRRRSRSTWRSCRSRTACSARRWTRSNRDIVFSFCQYGMGNVWEWGERLGGNWWRTTGDINDTWSSMAGIGFKQAGHEKYAGPGHWNDPDMLVVGKVGWGPQLHPTRLTPNEQTTHISLWCLLCSPLLIGCDMADMDPFTLSLLTNDEVLEVSQDPLGQPGRPGRASRRAWRCGPRTWKTARRPSACSIATACPPA